MVENRHRVNDEKDDKTLLKGKTYIRDAMEEKDLKEGDLVDRRLRTLKSTNL